MKSQLIHQTTNWDEYFYNICVAVSSKSPCMSRKIGAIIVRDHSVVSTGYNGPARGIPHCGRDRMFSDNYLLREAKKYNSKTSIDSFDFVCPRRVLGYNSGTHMELCPAQHAEENAVSNAARLGVSTLSSTLYMNSVMPCTNCLSTLINAGIYEIVVTRLERYDEQSEYIINNSNITIREFNYER